MRKLDDYHLIIDNKEIKHFSFVNVTQEFDWHHSFDVRVPISIVQNGFEKWLGKIVKVTFREQIGNRLVENSFLGVTVKIGTDKETLENTEVIIYAQSPTFLLDSRKHCRSFTDKSLKQIVQAVLGEYPGNLLNPRINPKTNKTIPYTVQYRESDYQFLRRLANFYGEWFFFDGAELYFGELPSRPETTLHLGRNLFSLDLSLKIEPTKFRLLAYNYRQAKSFDSASASQSVASPHSFSQLAKDVSDKLLSQETILPAASDIKEKDELDEMVKNRKSAMVNDLVVLSGISDAPELETGKIVKVRGAGEQDGTYLIISVSHNISSGGRYENQFEAVPAGVESPPEVHAVLYPQSEVQTAVVKENNDPDGMGRIRVQFLWQKPPEMSPWIRVVTAHAGENKGMYFIPEIGDEVLIGFENNHPERPFVIGSVYHGKAKPSEWQDEENNKKAIKTRSGNQVYFSDEEGKEEIRIFNKDKTNEICLTMEGNGRISIKSNDTLELSAKSIIIKAEKDITIQSNNGETSIEAMNTNLKSSGKLEIDGGSLAEIKASVIKLN